MPQLETPQGPFETFFAKIPIEFFPIYVKYFDTHSRKILHSFFMDGPAYHKVPAIRSAEHTFITLQIVYGDGKVEEIPVGA